MSEFAKTGRIDDSGCCPKCMERLNGWASFGHSYAPRENDITMCCRCLTLLIFDSRLNPRFPTEQEYIDLMTDPEMRNTIFAMYKQLTDRRSGS